MKPQDLIKKYVHQAQIMQLATTSGDQPWVCTVWFGADEMKDWWDLASPMEHASETVIPEASTFEETVALIGRIAGLNLNEVVKSSN